MSISAVVITLNEEKNLLRCLEALRFADEIVVVDSGSTDRTLDLARGVTGKVYFRKFDNFSAQKNFAVSKATNEWILSIDADEFVDSALAREARRVVSSKPIENAFTVLRRTKLFGREFRFSGLQWDKPIRFFRKEFARFEQPVHEKVMVEGRVGELCEALRHVSFQTIGAYWQKLQLYTSLENGQENSALGPGHFLLRPFYRFFSMYVWGQGFRDGTQGFIYCVLSSYYEFVRWAKHWEKRRADVE